MQFAVDKPLINAVMDMDSSKVLTAQQAFGDQYDRVVQMRTELLDRISEGEPKFTCAVCGTALHINSMKASRRFYFKHSHEDGTCPIKTREALSQEEIDARRYNGAKESKEHRAMKEWIRMSLAMDPEFSDIQTEQPWKGKQTGGYRRPDVRGTYRDVPVVFEVQLSSTYVNVMAARKRFYLAEGAMLLWVFAEFDEALRAMVQEDVFYNNNQNAFLVTADTVTASREQGKLMLECVWREPVTPTVVKTLTRRVVAFDQLTLKQSAQQVYFYDFYGERGKLEEAQTLAQRQREQERITEVTKREHQFIGEIRANFQHQWVNWVEYSILELDEWTDLAESFQQIGLYLPDHPGSLPSRILNAVFSLQLGRPFGWDYKQLIEVAHVVLPGNDRGKMDPYLKYFWQGVTVFKRADEIRASDHSGKWREKVRQHKELLRRGIKPPPGDGRFHKLFPFVFPELVPSSAEQPTVP